MSDGNTPPLVSAEWVAAHADDPDVVLLEVSEETARYYAGHIPGARPVDWLDDLHHPLRRGFVDPLQLGALLSSLGASNDSHLVLYGDARNAFAASAFWLLRYYRHRRLSLLDGGWTAWQQLDLPPSSDTPPVPPGRYVPGEPDLGVRATRDDITRRFVGAPTGTAIIDCRSSGEYQGTAARGVDLPVERHRVPGHVPGAAHLDAFDLLDPGTDRFLPVPELRDKFESRGATSEVEVALYCRIADRSSLLWFALHELLGHPRVRNYDGGWSEYGSLIDVPVTR